jgi:hypothetical protein
MEGQQRMARNNNARPSKAASAEALLGVGAAAVAPSAVPSSPLSLKNPWMGPLTGSYTRREGFLPPLGAAPRPSLKKPSMGPLDGESAFTASPRGAGVLGPRCSGPVCVQGRQHKREKVGKATARWAGAATSARAWRPQLCRARHSDFKSLGRDR